MAGKLYIKTFGCQMNEYDSAKMADVLSAAEHLTPTDRPEDADVLVFNTCSVREKAQKKVFSDLGRAKDLSGLKGRAVGPVSVSPTHANFLVNAGDAKAADFIELMRAVRAEVKSRQGVELQPEIVALGREWKELL